MVGNKYFILKTSVFKESDLVIYALNNQGGKEHFLARGALKSKKRFGGGLLEPLNYVELQIDNRKEKSQFVPITDARLLHGFEKLRSSYDKLEVALSLALDMLRFSVEGGNDTPELFHLLGNALKALEETEEVWLLQLHFRIKLLFYSGFLDNESGDFNAVLREPIQNFKILNSQPIDYLKRLSEAHFRELMPGPMLS
ncbi:MAG: DNA repair protein RecO [Bdellovibrionales bacterium]|nr:DNA repair protein RecO [Bdellovibrionales bacterium]